MSDMHVARFTFFDAIGSILYGACFIFLGYFFSNQIDQIESAFASVGVSALLLIGGVVVAYIAYKYWQRRRLLDELRIARITVDELRKKLVAGETPIILDMRSSAELLNDPVYIEGAVHLTTDDVKERRYTIPANSDVVVYCSCPNEVTAARVALLLKNHGISRVHPLLGGIDAWRKQNYPLSKRQPLQLSENAGEGRTA
jgi:rhodanese-related sulfurtransferase